MPCYSRIESRMTTKLEGMATVEQAAKLAGLKVERTGDRMVVFDAYNAVIFETVEGRIDARSYDGQEIVNQFLKKIAPKYGELRLKQFAQKRGYTVTREVQTVKVGR